MTTSLGKIKTIDALALKQLLDRHAVTLVDVREPGEYAEAHIPGAALVPLSQFDVQAISQQAQTKLVLYCGTAKRSAIAAQKLLDADFGEVTHLDRGLGAWKAAGYLTEAQPDAPISLMRQVQIVAGALMLIGTLLGSLVSPWFLFLSGFVGAGLVFAGVTDTCLLGMLLAKLPYNQRSRA